jgi:hypothetical protein
MGARTAVPVREILVSLRVEMVAATAPTAPAGPVPTAIARRGQLISPLGEWALTGPGVR